MVGGLKMILFQKFFLILFYITKLQYKPPGSDLRDTFFNFRDEKEKWIFCAQVGGGLKCFYLPWREASTRGGDLATLF